MAKPGSRPDEFSPLRQEAALSAGAAVGLAALLAWAGPPGGDLAAHVYQRGLFVQHGFVLWNNFWYAGRYSFITYSVLYYPLAAWLGIRLLAVATIGAAAFAFAMIIGRQWGPIARWSSRSFALVWAGVVLSAAMPFALGAALALLAVSAVQARHQWRFACLACLTLAASPLAFLLLTLVLAGIGIGQRTTLRSLRWPGVVLAAGWAIEMALGRVFPGGGRYPFSFPELAASCLFCAVGVVLTWRVERARTIRWIFPIYSAACLGSFLVSSAVGENIARLRYAALPIAVLVLALRNWRPRLVAVAVLGCAVAWNISPLAANFISGGADPTANSAYWQPGIEFLHRHLTPSYRVEVVDTAGHWSADYLPRAGIPIARGWFRQDDFPQNELLYGPLGPRSYVAWLHRLGVAYVLLTDATPDYSARAEARLLRSRRSPLKVVFEAAHLTIYAVPDARRLITGPGRASVLHLTQTRLLLAVGRRGAYGLAVRYSPYWHPSRGCVSKTPNGMIRLALPTAGRVLLRFDLTAATVLDALTGSAGKDCSR